MEQFEAPMPESFVAVCDRFLKLSAKCVCNINEQITSLNRKFSSFYLKHGKQAALSLILLVTFDVKNATLPQ